jgi:outer membrane protein assembly factor BamB
MRIGVTPEGHNIEYGDDAARTALGTSLTPLTQFVRTDGARFVFIDGGWIQTHSTGGAALVTDADYKYGPIYVDATYEYYGKTHDIDAALSDPVWQVRRMRLSDSYVQYADGNVLFDNVFTDLSTVAGLSF